MALAIAGTFAVVQSAIAASPVHVQSTAKQITSGTVNSVPPSPTSSPTVSPTPSPTPTPTSPPAGFTYERVIVDPVAENQPWMKAIGDLNGDQIADLDHDGLFDIVSSEYRGRGRLTIYRQSRDSAGTISWQATQLGIDKLHNIQAADLNGDCKLDFFGAYSLSGSTPVVLYRSTGANICR